MRQIHLRVFLCLFCFIIFICSFAQDNFYVDKMDSMFQPLNKTYIASNILYNRVYPFPELHSFNGSVDTTESSLVEQAYFELYNSA